MKISYILLVNEQKHWLAKNPKINKLKHFSLKQEVVRIKFDKTSKHILTIWSKPGFKGIVQPFELGGETTLIRSAVKY